MSDLKKQLIKLGTHRKDLRPHIRPVLARLEKTAGEFFLITDAVGELLEGVFVAANRRIPVGVKIQDYGVDGTSGNLSMRLSDGNQIIDYWFEVKKLEWSGGMDMKVSFTLASKAASGGVTTRDRSTKSLQTAEVLGKYLAEVVRNDFGM